MALTKQQRNALIAKIEKLPAQLEGAVRGSASRSLDTTYREGGWTARQVIHHLADSHMNAYIRARLALTENNPTLKPYNQDDWAVLEDASRAPIRYSLTILRGIHARWALLLRSLPEEAWARPAQHPEYGPTSVEAILKTYAGHGEKHLQHVKTALKKAATTARRAGPRTAKKRVAKRARS